MTKLLELLGVLKNSFQDIEADYFNSQLEVLRIYASANPDTVILPGYKIQDGLNLADNSISNGGEIPHPPAWETEMLGLCSRSYTEKMIRVYEVAAEYLGAWR